VIIALSIAISCWQFAARSSMIEIADAIIAARECGRLFASSGLPDFTLI
jgi:hypothetical protein